MSDMATANMIRCGQVTRSASVDAVMMLPISYWKLSEREIEKSYTSIGAAIDIPIVMHNNPATK